MTYTLTHRKNFLGISLIVIIFLRFLSEGIDLALGLSLSRLLSVLIFLFSISIFLTSSRLRLQNLSINFYMLLFLLSTIISSFMSPIYDLSGLINRYIIIISFLVLFQALLILLSNKYYIELLFNLLKLYFLLQLLFVFIQFLTNSGWQLPGKSNLAYSGGSSHPTIYGVVLFIIFSLYSLIHIFVSKRGINNQYIFFFMLFIFLLFLSYSRTAWGMCIIFCFIYFLNYFRSSLAKVIISIIAISIMSLVYLDILLSFINMNFDRFVYTENNSSGHWRVFQWVEFYRLALEKPIFGWGPGQATYLSSFDKNAHSSLVDTLVEGGILGLFLFSLFIFSCYRSIIDSSKLFNTSTRFINIVSTIYISVFFGMAFGISFFNQYNGILLFTLTLALSISIKTNILKYKIDENSSST